MADGRMNFTTDEETGDVLYETQQPEVGETNASSGQVELINTLSQKSIDQLATKLTEGVDGDTENSAELSEMRKQYLELMGVGKESKEEDDEEAADTSDHTLLLTALLRFQAKALSTLLPSDDSAVRTKTAMDTDQIEDPDERQRAVQEFAEAGDRVEKFYTEYLFERLPSYEEDTDQLLFDMGLMGAGLRKISVDESNEHMPVTPEYVPLENLLISYDGKRLTHKIPMTTQELVRKMVSGRYKAVTLTPGLGGVEMSKVTSERDIYLGLGEPDEDETHMIYEVYCELFLAEDRHPKGLARPYLVTIHAASNTVLSVQRNWERNDPTERPAEHFVFYIYHPGKNAVTSMGLGSILGNVTRSLRKAQRRALEAAYLQNHPSGFKLGSLKIRDEATKVLRGQFVDVDSPTDDIRKSIMPHPFQGPSQGLLALADGMEKNGKELGGIASIDFAQLMKAGVAAGPAMAAFEESTEFQTSVHRRLYKAHRKELKLIHDKMRSSMGNREVVYGDGQNALKPDDLMKVDVIPYMKPGQVSKQKMIMEAQATVDLAEKFPDVIDKRLAAEEFLRAMGKPNIDDIMLPAPDDEESQPQPTDPITEYSMIVQGQPVRAAPQQNHKAHLDIHASQLRMIAESQMPVEMGEQAMAALSAHIAEHVGFDLMADVAAVTGIPMEQFGQMDPQTEMQIAPMIAQAMMQIEAQQKGEEQPEESKAQIEMIKGENARAREQDKIAAQEREAEMKRAHERDLEALKHQHALELQSAKDAAAMDREIEDNTTAIKIAKSKPSGGGSATAAAKAGAKNPAGGGR